jgi:hypothetical protein
MVRMKSEKISVDEVRKACEELAEMGLIQDSGRRRNGCGWQRWRTCPKTVANSELAIKGV